MWGVDLLSEMGGLGSISIEWGPQWDGRRRGCLLLRRQHQLIPFPRRQQAALALMPVVVGYRPL